MNLFKRVRILKINPAEPENEAVSIAAEIIREGGIVAFPTETVYGLAANMLNKQVIARVYKIKNRPSGKPLTVHISDMDVMEEMVGEMPPFAKKLISNFWPGPLTIILYDKNGRKAGFRMPSNRIALSLIKASGVPIVAPSANTSGRRPPRDTAEILDDLEDDIDMILDGGPTEVGIESTVVDLTIYPYKMLREGAISREKLQEAWSNDGEKQD